MQRSVALVSWLVQQLWRHLSRDHLPPWHWGAGGSFVYIGHARRLYFGWCLYSVADPGCLSRIPDLGSKKATKERGEKKFDVKPFYVATKFNKIVNYFSFEVLKKKIWANFQRIIELFIKKIVKKLFKIWSWDPGVKKAPDPGSGSATLCLYIPYCTVVPRAPEKEDLNASKLFRRTDSAGPVSPTCFDV